MIIKFLVIAQDLRVVGTSEGIVSRSFLAKLRATYPNAIIDVLYLKSQPSEDQLHLLPVNSIQTYILNLKASFFTKWLNKIYWRIFHISLTKRHIDKMYGSYIAKVDYEKYDHIFIRSSGLDHEVILGSKDLPILKKAIINFHDPYPLFWNSGSLNTLTNLELFKLKEMLEVVTQAKTCMSSANLMSEDLQFLYGSRKKFYTLPHQFQEDVFDLTDVGSILKKNKKIMISYHGAIMFGRDIEIVLDAYEDLVANNPMYKENTEFVIRVKGIDLKKLKDRYSNTPNIVIMGTLNFSNSCNEQMHEADINIILENGPLYSNILGGKAAFLAALKKPILSIAPERSEIRRIISDQKYVATYSDILEIKNKLEDLIIDRINSDEAVYPFGDYFSDENFKCSLEKILNNED